MNSLLNPYSTLSIGSGTGSGIGSVLITHPIACRFNCSHDIPKHVQQEMPHIVAVNLNETCPKPLGRIIKLNSGFLHAITQIDNCNSAIRHAVVHAHVVCIAES